MQAQVKAITLRAGYESNLKETLQQDISAIKSFKRNLEKNPIKVPIRLDLSGVRADATRAANEYKKALSAALSNVKAGGGGVSKGGIIIPASAMGEMKEFAATGAGAFKEVRTETGKLISSYEQLAAGIQRVTNVTKKGKNVKLVDTQPLENFQRALADIERKFAARIGTAKGSGGDVASILREKQQAIVDVLKDPKLTAAVRDTPVYQKADRSLDRLEERIEAMTGTQNKRAAKQSRGLRIDSLKERLLSIDEGFATSLGTFKGTKGDMAALLANKRATIEKSLQDFSDIADSPAYKQARKAMVTLDQQIAAAIPRQKQAEDKKARDGRIGALKNELLAIDNAIAGNLGRAQGGRGDVAKVLEDKRRRIGQQLASFTDIADSPAFRQAQKSFIALDQQIEAARPRQKRAADKQQRDSRIAALKDSLLAIDTAMSGQIGSAKGNRGDVARLLEQKRQRIANELAAFADIADSPAFKGAQRSINTLTKQIEEAVPKQARRAESELRKNFNARAGDLIARQDDRLNRRLVKQSKGDEADARAIQDRVTRERVLNQVLDKRERLLERQIARYRRLEDAANRAGFGEAATRFRNAGNRVGGMLEQVRLDRRREGAENLSTLNATLLKRQLDAAVQYERVQREQLRNDEAAARRIKDRATREAELNRILTARRNLTESTRQRVQAIGRQAEAAGLTGLSDRAKGTATNYQKQAIADMRKLDAATTKSGHAFNFHTSSLLKNAATFTRWYVPAQLAMGAFAALSSGMAGAVQSERTFKILNAVFRGTAEEARMLADETLLLAAANGRSADEAAQAAVAWARMGLTRTQVLVAMESSLRAANVAEISAAEATAYLTATYKAFGQTIADIPATLDYINALSNKNAVAPKEIFEGLSRSAAIAKQAGVEFETLAGIITTVTEVTQRPGAEIGNAIKTVITRLNRPAVTNELKKQFGIDLTTPEGDAKKMTQILGELAAIYPTLNTLEKGRLKNIVAGANQGNRFAIIMESWTNSLIAQAKAGLDANSAMRENAQIIDTVSAKLQNLSTSWTRLFHTMGEAGAFDFITGALQQVSGGIDSVATSMGKLTGGRTGGAGGFGTFVGRVLTGQMSATELMLVTGSYFGGGPKPNLPTPPPDTRLQATELGRLAQRTTQSRNRVRSLGAADEALRIMSRQFGTSGVPNQRILEQFDQVVEVLAELPGGQANVAQARLAIRPLLEKGNIKEGRRALDQTAARLFVAKEGEFATSESQRAEAIAKAQKVIALTSAEVERLNNSIASTQPGEAQQELQKELYKTEQALKDQQNSLATLQQQFEKPMSDPLAGLRESLDAYMADLKLIGDTYGQLMTTFGSSGFSNLDAALKMGAARMEGNLLEQSIRSTIADNAAFDVFGADPANKEAREAALTAMQYRLEEIRKATQEDERKVELERQTGMLRNAYDDSRRSTAAGFGRYDIGRSEGARMAARTGGILRELQTSVNDPFLGRGDATADAQDLGAITERMSGVKEGIASMEDRINRALAERVNLESEITEENRKQNEEAARSLAMASREDQLRAAAAAAVLRARGGNRFSMEEFQFFSQETRGAISNFLPRGVKGLDPSERNQAESRANLDREIAGLAVSLKAMRDSFAAILPDAEKKAAGLIDLQNPLGTKAPAASRIMDLDKEKVAMNLNTGPITVNLDFSRHVQSIKDSLQATFDLRFKALTDSIRRTLGSTLDPNTAAAAAAY